MAREKNLKSKFFIYFIIALVILLFSFSGVFYKEKQFLEKKAENLYRDKYTELIVLYLNSSLKHINNTAKDWGIWNDTYNFVITKNKQYVKDNFPGNTLKNLGIDYMLFFDRKGFVFGVGRDDSSLNTNPLGFVPVKVSRGFVRVNGIVYFYASSKILPSDGYGSSRGVLVVLKRVRVDKLKKYIESIKMGSVPCCYEITRKNDLKLGFYSKNGIQYIVLFDINDKPIASLLFSLQPSILHYIYRFITINIFGLAVIFIFLSGGLIYFGVSKYFIRKLDKLSKRIEDVPANLDVLYDKEIVEKEFEPILETVFKLVERIKESEYMFEKIADIIPAGIIICGEKIVYANRYAKEVIGSEIVGRDIRDVLQKEDQEVFAKNIERRRKGEQFTTTHILKLNTPSHVIVYAVSTSVKYKGEYLSLSTFVNITEIFTLKEKYQRIVEHLPYGVFHKIVEIEDEDVKNEKNLYISKEIKEITLYDEEEVSSLKSWESYIVSGEIDKIKKLIESGKAEYEYRMRKKDGKIIWVKDVSIVLSKEKNRYEILNIIEDITKRKKISMFYQTLYRINAIKVKSEREDELLNSICTCLAVTCAFKFVWIGKVEDNKVKPLFEYGDRSLSDAFKNYSWISPYIKNDSLFNFSNDSISYYSATLPIVIDNKVEYTLNVYSEIFSIFDDEFLDLLKQLASDIGDSIKRIRYRKELLYEFYHDKLTGLKNFTSLNEKIGNISKGSLIYLRVDNLLTLNQVYGIEFSNRVIKKIGRLIAGKIEDKGEVFKIPGNRFAVFLNETDRDELLNIVESIKSATAEIVLDDNKVQVTLSVGISVYPDLVSDKKDFIISAETALVKAKQTGRVEFYSEDIRKIIEEHFRISNYIKTALKENRFFFHYQPVLDLNNGKITKCEALIRLKDEDGKMVSPEKFISIAEQMNLIRDITLLVVDKVLKQTEKIPDIDVAINISAKDINDRALLKAIKDKLTHTNRRGFSIEITERDIVENISRASEFVKELRKLGIKVEIDDFGVKYSSLNRLIEMEFDVIKIDKTLVDIIGNRKAERVIEYIVELAHSLGAKIQAEGVETKEQFDFLRKINCDYIQGYYISKPLDFDQFLSFIGRYNAS